MGLVGLVAFYGISTLVNYLMPNPFYTYVICKQIVCRYYLPIPPLGQDMTQGQFLSGV